MDPVACWKRICELSTEPDDQDEYNELWEALWSWIKRGGATDKLLPLLGRDPEHKEPLWCRRGGVYPSGNQKYLLRSFNYDPNGKRWLAAHDGRYVFEKRVDDFYDRPPAEEMLIAG